MSAYILKLIFRNAAPVAVTVACSLLPEGFAAALSSRPGRAAKAEPMGYDLGRLLRCDRRRNGNGIPNGKGRIINFAADKMSQVLGAHEAFCRGE